jgi:hypothetical protein
MKKLTPECYWAHNKTVTCPGCDEDVQKKTANLLLKILNGGDPSWWGKWLFQNVPKGKPTRTDKFQYLRMPVDNTTVTVPVIVMGFQGVPCQEHGGFYFPLHGAN